MLTALQVAEQIDLLAGKVSGEKAEEIRSVMREAERILRGAEKKRPMTEDDLRLIMRDLERGLEFAVYLEDRGYYKLEAAIIDRAFNDTIRVMYSNGMRYVFEMRDYNRTWRLWDSIPSGVEMKMAEWRART